MAGVFPEEWPELAEDGDGDTGLVPATDEADYSQVFLDGRLLALVAFSAVSDSWQCVVPAGTGRPGDGEPNAVGLQLCTAAVPGGVTTPVRLCTVTAAEMAMSELVLDLTRVEQRWSADASLRPLAADLLNFDFTATCFLSFFT